jgi:hypothetical protein
MKVAATGGLRSAMDSGSRISEQDLGRTCFGKSMKDIHGADDERKKSSEGRRSGNCANQCIARDIKVISHPRSGHHCSTSPVLISFFLLRKDPHFQTSRNIAISVRSAPAVQSKLARTHPEHMKHVPLAFSAPAVSLVTACSYLQGALSSARSTTKSRPCISEFAHGVVLGM